MEQRFSAYLTEIGLLNETTSSTLLKKDDKASNKSFADTSFECLKNYFDNLDEEQKNYMSLYIPSKFIYHSEKIKKSKLKSIIIQLILRKRFILLKYFITWKKNSYLLSKIINNNIININKNNNNDINYEENAFNNITSKYLENKKNKSKKKQNEYKDNKSKYNIINIDGNVDVDNRHMTKTEQEEEKTKKKIKINKSNDNSISFANSMIQDNYFKNDNNYIKKNNLKNDRTKNINNSKNKNKNKGNVSLKSNGSNSNYNTNIISNNRINTNKSSININSYKTININNYKNPYHRSNYNSNIMKNTSKNKKIHTSLEEKEIFELKECTFKPRINNPKKLSKRNLSQSEINSSLIIPNNINFKRHKKDEEVQLVFEKLYRDSEKYKLAKEMKAIEMEHIMSRKTPFAPNTEKYSKKNSVSKKRQKSEGNFESFNERQKEYLLKKNRHSAEITSRINSDYEEVCSFNPKITNDKGEYYQITIKEKINKKPVHIRLYEDNKDRENFHKKKEIENINKILDLSNILNPQKYFNFETINRLYENKEKYTVMSKTKKKVEKEEGITFKPYIPVNAYTKGVNGNFYERGQKLLNDRESFYEDENKKYDEGNKKKVGNKEYSKEERKTIIDNIINRLYNEPILANKKPVSN